jgi:hypothetical protein
MAARNISRLIQESQDALEANDIAGAKQKALQAIAGINIEKDKLLKDVQTDINEQQLGDWYGGCSFVMNRVWYLLQVLQIIEIDIGAREHRET